MKIWLKLQFARVEYLKYVETTKNLVILHLFVILAMQISDLMPEILRILISIYSTNQPTDQPVSKIRQFWVQNG